MPLLVCLVVLLLSVAGDAAHGASAPVLCGSRAGTRAPRAVPRLGRVVVIVLENKSCAQVVGSAQAPYLTRLARRGAFASRYYAVAHPSLPNYLALVGGSTFGVSSDCAGCSVRGTSLVDQLERARVSWKAYMEGMPRPCFGGAFAGRYAKRHDPFAYFADVAARPGRCRRIVPLRQLDADIARHALPRFVWITPDLCHDMHSCPVADGDRFLSRLVPRLDRAIGPRGAIFVTWDEGLGRAGCCGRAAGGSVATIVAGPAARPGGRSGLAYDHYSLLRTIEDGFGLPRLRGAACPCTRSLSALLR